MYINPKFWPLEPHFFHFPLESERGAWVREHKHIFLEKRGSNTTLGKNSSQSKIFKRETFSCFKNINFHSVQQFSLQLRTLFIKLKTFLHSTLHETNQLTFACISLTIQNSWNLLHFGSKHVSWWFNMKKSSCASMHKIWEFFYQNCSLAHEIHHLAYMTSILVLALNHPRFWWNLVIIFKTSKKSHLSFHIVSKTFKISNYPLMTLHLPSH